MEVDYIHLLSMLNHYAGQPCRHSSALHVYLNVHEAAAHPA